jgi:hypothetical protein
MKSRVDAGQNQTRRSEYHLADGTRVPSVTTIISRFKESGGLVHWAWQLGQTGKDYRVERDRAADAGSMAHAAVEAWIHGRDPAFDGEPEVVDKAKRAFSAFREWTEQTRLQVTHTELPLVSEYHRFGGTFDAVVMNKGRALADWKTSQRCYPEYLVQLAAYGHLWAENFPSESITAGFHLLRFDKIYGDFHHHFWSELERAWMAFLHLRELYEIDKELRDRIS